MKILGIHIDVCHLGGHTRLFLMMMDLFKSLGHKIEVISRKGEESEGEVQAQTMDAKTARPLLIPAKIRIFLDTENYTIPQIKDYQPIRHLTPLDFTQELLPLIHWGDHFIHPWPEKVKEKIDEADFVFTDSEMYIRIEENLDIAKKHIQYVHFPTASMMPVYNKEPSIWCNSSFTRSWIRIRWGFNNPFYAKFGKKYATMKIPNQVFNAEIVHPPLYIGDYENSNAFRDRNFDVVMFARLGEDKFTVANYLNKHFKLLSLGAQRGEARFRQVIERKSTSEATQVDLNLPKKPFVPYKPKGDLHKNIKFKEIKQYLGKSKVYVHGKGFGVGESGEISEPEHFGITVCEALAAGCPAIVPRTGGCWTDISMLGKYCPGYSSPEELSDIVKNLVSDEKEWSRWHYLGLERVQAFNAETLIPRLKDLLK